MKEICKRDSCTGCGVCANICPQSCIIMKLDNEGFLIPEIDEDKCVNCNLCKKNCPALNSQSEYIEHTSPIQVFRGKSRDNRFLARSTSGGIFPELANQIIMEKGVVVGAILNQDLSVSHIAVSNIKELEKLCGSKYVGSNMMGIYREVKEYLKNGTRVLFSGTPCQIAGLNLYLKDISKENLVTCDFICHGVGSLKIFRAFIKNEQKKAKSECCDVKFRSKKSGYTRSSLQIQFKSGKQKFYPSYRNAFGYPFSTGMINRSSCAACKYASVERVSDITLGDMVHNLSRDEKIHGCSVIMANTEKGKKLLDMCSIEKKAISLEYVLSVQAHLSRPQAMHADRNIILNQDCLDFENIYEHYLKPPKRNVLKSILRRLSK